MAIVIGPTPPGTGVIALAFFDTRQMHVAHESVAALACRVFDAINSHVNNDSSFADVIGFQKFCASNGSNDNVGRKGRLLEIAAARMHDGYRRVAASSPFLHEQEGQRFSNDHAAPKDHHVGAGDRDVAFREAGVARPVGVQGAKPVGSSNASLATFSG